MRGTISVVFTLHTLLCSGYVAWLALGLSRWIATRVPAEQASLEAMMGQDERMTTAASHGTVLLYLGYAEIYLLHSWQLFK